MTRALPHLAADFREPRGIGSDDHSFARVLGVDRDRRELAGLDHEFDEIRTAALATDGIAVSGGGAWTIGGGGGSTGGVIATCGRRPIARAS